MTTEPRCQMIFTRHSHREDILFVIALLVPTLFASACCGESDCQIAQIARARSRAAPVAAGTQAPPSPVVAQAQIPNH